MNADFTDAELVQRFRDGDDAAFDALTVRYGRMVRVMISRHENIEAIVEELAQEAFISAFVALRKPDGGPEDAGKFGQWIGSIATRKGQSEAVEGAKRRDALEGKGGKERTADRALVREVHKAMVAKRGLNIPGMFRDSSGIAGGADYNPHDDPGNPHEPAAPVFERSVTGWYEIRHDIRDEIAMLDDTERGKLSADQRRKLTAYRLELQEELFLSVARQAFIDGLPSKDYSHERGGFALFRGVHKGYRPPKWPRMYQAEVAQEEEVAVHLPDPAARPTPQIGTAVASMPVLAGEITDVSVATAADQIVAVMRLLAALAYPESHKRRDHAMQAMHVMLLRAAKNGGQTVPPGGLLNAMKAQQQHRALDDLSDRINERLYAARVAAMLLLRMCRPIKTMALPTPGDEAATHLWLSKVLSSGPARAQAWRDVSGDRYSLNDFAKHSNWTAARFKSETWRPEVIHLGMALDRVVAHWDDPRGFGIFTMLANPGWIVAAVARAERLARILQVAGQSIEGLSGIRAERQVHLVASVAISEPVTSQI